MIEAITTNLDRAIRLLENLSDEQYSDKSIPPYYSSIGGHVRHILDLFTCVFEGLPSGEIDLTARRRNPAAETYTKDGIAYCRRIQLKLSSLDSNNLNRIVEVTDDLGMGTYVQEYTLGGLLIQAHSHAIHHFASIGYIIAQLDVHLPDNDFGYNPSTPRNKKSEVRA